MKQLSWTPNAHRNTTKACRLVRYFYETFYKTGRQSIPTQLELARAEKEIGQLGSFEAAKRVISYVANEIPRGRRALSFFDVWTFKVSALEANIKEAPTVSYVQEHTRCNNERCRKCTTSRGAHGTYWYGYWYDGNGKKQKRYIGKELKQIEKEIV